MDVIYKLPKGFDPGPPGLYEGVPLVVTSSKVEHGKLVVQLEFMQAVPELFLSSVSSANSGQRLVIKDHHNVDASAQVSCVLDGKTLYMRALNLDRPPHVTFDFRVITGR